MSADTAQQFRDLARELEPLERQAGEIKMKMLTLMKESTAAKVTAAFPAAAVITTATITTIKPNDMAKNADTAIRAIQSSGLVPDLIIIDEQQFTVTLAKRK